ncbi:hypothetical protein B1B12_12825 (plasmid) [Cutibacterium acnes subsp. defendens]|nr:hypothetical protein B1B12_12825 [Cutibacterium acnes subsp. defendens]RFT44669.1 hypothetical protein CHT93_11035 [Staphylococcus epidermidis]
MFVGDDTLHDVVDTWSRARSAMEEARLPLSGAIIAERIRTDATEAEPMEQTGLLCWVIPSGCARRMGGRESTPSRYPSTRWRGRLSGHRCGWCS